MNSLASIFHYVNVGFFISEPKVTTAVRDGKLRRTYAKKENVFKTDLISQQQQKIWSCYQKQGELSPILPAILCNYP